ncbi:LytR/AlgR family response regulator transcription factor [Niabella drilacis]|uniref:Two component transcriptional regulator, LytTR family n=1 Tax=Niabella drilacis (strain DSM 25811 / CCM 8410 / CCUG 62505 / LMG 26954 / E90) TaxID=1285928 RepID=A0A1G6JJN2_NIADE|nr:LytTR family DNA-binding domain-containing protein [Niabella drilacis]SDC18992.1 two component transcriptional regulator, LytTR family [Niabella drilacis]
MTTVIIEDENFAIKRLSRLLSVDRSIEIMAVLKSIPESVEWLRGHPAPDLIFMDIKLAKGQCLEAFKSPVVFTTSYHEHILCAFEVPHMPVTPVLAKPETANTFSENLALTSVNVFRQMAGMQDQAGGNTGRRRFLVKSGTRRTTIETTDIAYFYVDRRATFLKTFENKKFIVDYTLEEIGAMLDPASFFRINRAWLVAAGAVREMEPFPGSRLSLQLMPAFNKDLLVSREKVKAFKRWIGQ